jgi:hypothetical protein
MKGKRTDVTAAKTKAAILNDIRGKTNKFDPLEAFMLNNNFTKYF